MQCSINLILCLLLSLPVAVSWSKWYARSHLSLSHPLSNLEIAPGPRAGCALSPQPGGSKKRPGFFFSYLKVCLSSESAWCRVRRPLCRHTFPLSFLLVSAERISRVDARQTVAVCPAPSARRHLQRATWTQQLSLRMWCRCWGRRACSTPETPTPPSSSSPILQNSG